MKMITPHVGFISGPVNIGFIRSGKKAVLVDTGLDKASAKRALQVAADTGVEITGILNTHGHADHYGGNATIKKSLKTLSFIYAPALEDAVIRYPILEPVYLFGANPIANLKGKFLMGASSPAMPLPSPVITFEGLIIQAISLPGHSINQTGYVCDRVFFCADTVFPKEIIEKYGLLYCFDVDSQKKTLQSLMKPHPYKMVVPCHARPRQNISLLAEENLQHMEAVWKAILGLLSTPKTAEAILAEFGKQMEIPLKSIWQYHLHKNTIKAYLAAMLKKEEVSLFLEKGKLVWVRK